MLDGKIQYSIVREREREGCIFTLSLSQYLGVKIIYLRWQRIEGRGGWREKKSQYGVTDPTSVHTRTSSLCHPPLSPLSLSLVYFSKHFREERVEWTVQCHTHTCSFDVGRDDLTTFNTCTSASVEGGGRKSSLKVNMQLDAFIFCFPVVRRCYALALMI